LTWRGAVWLGVLVVTALAQAPGGAVARVDGGRPPADAAVDDEEPAEDPTPAYLTGPLLTWEDAERRYQTECPAPYFSVRQPHTVEVMGHRFLLKGSSMFRQGGRWQGPLTLGVLGGIDGLDPATRKNLKVAMREFKKRGVHFVIVNGDVAHGEFEILDALRFLGRESPAPVLVHVGDSEGKGGFTRSVTEAAKHTPHLFNMTLIRHVDLGGIHVVSLPGHHDMRMLNKAGCYYLPDHVREMRRRVRALTKKGDTVVLSAHTPPHGSGPHSLDLSHDHGHMGDPDVTDLLRRGRVSFGVFGHVLEAGGRVVADPAGEARVDLPMKAPAPRLYLNAGTSNAVPWKMLDGKASRGLAAVLVIQDRKGTAEFITLRKGRR
jgi:hypothetical protein